MAVPCDAIVNTADLLSLRHTAPLTYRQICRLYTAYLRGIKRLGPIQVVDKQYLLAELGAGRVTALAVNCTAYLRLVGLTSGTIVEYHEAVLVCAELEIVAKKWQFDQKYISPRRDLLQQACLRYATDHVLINTLSPQCRIRQKVLWRSPCSEGFTTYQWQGTRLVRA